MEQKDNININNIRQIVADYVKTVKYYQTPASDVALMALMSFQAICEQIYGYNFTKEIMEIIKKKETEPPTKISIQ